MSWKDSNKQYELFYNNSYEAMHGNIKLGAKVFLQSIISNIKKNSSTIEILRRFKEKKLSSSLITFTSISEKCLSFDILLTSLII